MGARAERRAESGTGAATGGHLVVPDTGHGTGVLVLCLPGAAVFAAEACARLARHGFVALAPALPGLAGESTEEAARAAVAGAVHALFCEHATDGARIGVLGFGRGCRLAFEAAREGARVGALVSFGGGSEAAEAHSRLRVQVPVLAVFAERDEAAASDGGAALEASLSAASAATLRVEAGVSPEYLDPARPDHYDAVAAQASWDAALAHFRAEL